MWGADAVLWRLQASAMAMWRREPEPIENQAEILDLRHFSSVDLRPLLEQESLLWTRTLAWDYRSSAEMILRYIDSKILPGYAAVENGSVIGYAFFVYEGNKGVVGDLFVAPGTPTGPLPLEHRLLTHVIDTLQQSPGVQRIEAQLLVHEAGTVAQPFLAEGFRRYPRIFMILPLGEAASGRAAEVPKEFEVRRWSDHDYQAVASLITAAYQHHVDSEINDQYRSVSGALRFLNNIVRFPGCGVFDPSSSYLAVHRSDRRVVGVILCSRVKEDVGHVTQICLLPDYRGRGIGKALLQASAHDLATRKFSSLTLTVTESNVGAVHLYTKLGFQVRRVFDAFVWQP